MAAELSDIVSAGVSVAAGASSAFWPQPSAAIARVSASRATIERAESLRIVFVFTSSHVRRAGVPDDGRVFFLGFGDSQALNLNGLESGAWQAASLCSSGCSQWHRARSDLARQTSDVKRAQARDAQTPCQMELPCRPNFFPTQAQVTKCFGGPATGPLSGRRRPRCPRTVSTGRPRSPSRDAIPVGPRRGSSRPGGTPGSRPRRGFRPG